MGESTCSYIMALHSLRRIERSGQRPNTVAFLPQISTFSDDDPVETPEKFMNSRLFDCARLFPQFSTRSRENVPDIVPRLTTFIRRYRIEN